MAAEMIELECPGCSEMLELDVGFAGGVCRCSSCSTLMTVPIRTGRGKAEALSRPDRPEGPGGGASAAPSRPRRPDAPGRSETPEAVSQAEDHVPAADEVRQQTYVTATGRVVTVDADAHIPTAGKRKRTGVRVLTIVAFCTLVVAVLAACIVAIVVLVKAPKQTAGGIDLDDPTQQALRLFAFDPQANPRLIEHPNVLGLPLSKKTAIVFDSLNASEALRSVAAATLAAGLHHPDVKVTVTLVATDAAKPVTFDGGPTGLGSLDREELTKFLSDMRPKQDQLAAAVGDAVAGSPDQLVIITTQRVRDASAVEEALRSRPALPMDVVDLGPGAAGLRDLVDTRAAGRYHAISQMRMEGWAEDAAAGSRE